MARPSKNFDVHRMTARFPPPYTCTRNYALLRVFAHIFGYNLVILLKKKKEKEKERFVLKEFFSERKDPSDKFILSFHLPCEKPLEILYEFV